MASSIYSTKPIGTLLFSLSKTISQIQNTYNKAKDVKIRYLIKELKTRDLSKLQIEKFNRLIIRYMWI